MQFVNIHTHRPTGRHIEPQGIGIHPWDAASSRDLPSAEITADAQLIGETGLDFACPVPHKLQESLFRRHLQLGAECDKPVIIHCVRAFEPTMKILAEYDLRAVIFHGFIGSPQQARQAVDRGYSLSFGPRSFRSPKTVEALKTTPLQNIFLETDDTDDAIEDVYSRCAAIKGLSVEELQAAILDNCKLIFERR